MQLSDNMKEKPISNIKTIYIPLVFSPRNISNQMGPINKPDKLIKSTTFIDYLNKQ